MAYEQKNEKHSLYILKYERTGCYYVGITETLKLKERMKTHFKANEDDVKCSYENRANEGFYYYWYDIVIKDERGLVLESFQDYPDWKTGFQGFAQGKVEDKVTQWLGNQVDEKFAVNGGGNAKPDWEPKNPVYKKTKETIEKQLKEKKTYSLEETEEELLINGIPEKFKNVEVSLKNEPEYKVKWTLTLIKKGRIKEVLPREK